MNIAICNEDKTVSDLIYDLLDRQVRESGIDADILRYESGEQLIQESDSRQFDLIYLDMFMDNNSGWKLGTAIREKCRDACLIYVSPNDGYVEEVFETEPVAFLKKPINPEIFEKSFNRVCKKLNDDAFFKFQLHHKITRVRLKDCMFFESRGRKVHLFLNNGEMIEFYAKLDDVEKAVEEITYCGYFLRTHKSFLVNESYIYKMEKKSMILKDGRKLPISRTYQTEHNKNFS